MASGCLDAARLCVHVGAAPRSDAVDVVDDALARGHRRFGAWLRDVAVLRGSGGGPRPPAGRRSIARRPRLARAGDGAPLPVLCFAGDLPPAYVAALVRGGADVDVFPVAAAPVPALVAAAARPWSPATHGLFPAATRRRVACVLRLARRLERTRGVPRCVFRAHVLPLAADRGAADAAADRAALLACYAGGEGTAY